MKHTILITGAAGYVGAMLVKSFAAREDVERIIGLDKEPLPDLLKDEPKLEYIQAFTSEPDWIEKAHAYAPDIVVHAAWQIRELYGDKDLEWQMNIDGSDQIFDFAFTAPSVTRLIHFSTVASYAAQPDNTLEHRFIEEEPFRKSEYLYAEEKRIAEEHLKEKYEEAKERGKQVSVAVVRPVAITGPRGRFVRVRFGLQAALSGQLRGNVLYRFISLLVSFVPVTKKWCRQFIHEDDVVDIVSTLAFSAPKSSYEVFNIAPPGDIVRGKDMAKAVGKRTLSVHPALIRAAFFVMWNLTRGRVPTSRGAWKSYSYPIVVDGTKLTREYGFVYRSNAYDSLYYTNGRYEDFVPMQMRRTRS